LFYSNEAKLESTMRLFNQYRILSGRAVNPDATEVVAQHGSSIHLTSPIRRTLRLLPLINHGEAPQVHTRLAPGRASKRS
jgi:hypothetical protein